MPSLDLVANLKGSQGVPGPIGLPGVDATPADAAVGGYVTGPSVTRTALLDSLGLAVPIHGAGIDPSGVADSTSAIQAIIDANPKRRLRLGAGVFKITALTLSKGQHLEGVGQQDYRDRFTSFGTAGWLVNANFGGTVIRSTLTSGVALTLLDTEVNSGGFSNFTLIGPGTGTSTGISMGSGTMSVVNPLVHSVKIGNFFLGLYTRNINEGSFYDLAVHGCTTGVDLNTATNQNAFYMLDIQRCGDGLVIGATSFANAFYSFIGQSNTGTAALISGKKNTFVNPYFENNTVRALDILPGGSGNNIHDPFMNGASDSVRIQAAADNNTITGFGGYGTSTPVTNAGSGTYLQGRFASLTDTSTTTILVDYAAAGSPFGPWVSYTPALAGTGWALGNGTVTGKYTIIGKTVHFRGKIVFGTTTTYGTVSPTITTPVGLLEHGDVQAFMVRSGVGTFALVPKLTTGGSIFTLWASGTNGALVGVTSTVPATWGATDYIEFSGTFERP